MRSDSQPWAKNLPEGSHRYPSRWLRTRYDWLHEDGPEEPQWGKCGKHAAKLEDMVDVCYHGIEGEKVKFACWRGTSLAEGVDEACIVIEADEEDLDAKMRQEMRLRSREARRNEIIDKMLSGSGQRPGGKEKAANKKAMRARRRQSRASMRKALKSWRNEQRELLKQYSRKQLLEALVPAAGEQAVKHQCKKKVEGISKSASKARSNT